MKPAIIAPIGGDSSAIFRGIREFGAEKIIILHLRKHRKDADNLKAELGKFSVPVSIMQIGEPAWELVFRAVGQLREEGAMINVGAADILLKSASISAAFVNGMKCFDVEGGKIMVLPVLKLPYYGMIPKKKMEILRFLARQPDKESSLDSITKSLGMSLPLLSYYVNGNAKTEGLKQAGLVETEAKGRRVIVSLASAGRLLMEGTGY
ncbi:MAG: winged helix-turn-helix transcriptional regulator [Candidatus Aenigmarchaeota archaeon]|nr:winged helix-turn-helix transcriptional regulator [Candidatus Aenigmarchaeota archaeon]